MTHFTDEQLIEKYLEGDCQSLELLIQRYMDLIYNYVHKYASSAADAEDLTQEVFIKVWKNLKKFKSGYKFKNWIFTIAKNTSLDFIKKKKAVVFSDLDNKEANFKFSDSIADKTPLAIEVLESEENLGSLNLALQELSMDYRKTLNLRYDQGLKFREIAGIFKQSINTVKTRHQRAILRLKKLLSSR